MEFTPGQTDDARGLIERLRARIDELDPPGPHGHAYQPWWDGRDPSNEARRQAQLFRECLEALSGAR